MKLNIYPTGSVDGSFIAQINIEADQISQTENKDPKTAVMTGPGRDVETIVLLDVSGSMGQNVRRVVTHYLPEALTLAKFRPDDQIKLVTFSNSSQVHKLSIDQLRASGINTEGATYMSPGVQNVQRLISSSPHQKIRLLTISDGQLHDQEMTMSTAHQLASLVKDKYQISSNAVRLYTSSYGHPDTRGLSSLLQLSNYHQKHDNIVDIDAYQKPVPIISQLVDLLTDNLGTSCQLTCQASAFLSTPWSTPSQQIHLVPGQNTFWLKDLSVADSQELKSKIYLDLGQGPDHQQEITVTWGQKLDFDSYQTILKEKVAYFMKRLRILKVVNTPEAQTEIGSIVNYFSQLEKAFSINDPSVADMLNNTLQSRLALFKHMAKKKKTSVSIQMSEIANDDRVSQLNSAQQADYLRSTALSANAKSLARRALKQGLDFDQTAIREVRQMKAHLPELADIDDQSHYVSFYSQESTLQGIKTVCELDDDEGTLDQMSTVEILQLLNIVGIPCEGPIGDFPDPKTYHITNLFLGSTVSMADVMIVKQQGQDLTDPYTKKKITNVVPFYDDDRIQQFLMKHAPTLLEYVSSIGLRNMILEVPHTYKYNIVGGVWNMARRLDKEKTDKNIDVFTKLVLTYKTAVNGLFDYVVPMIREPSAEDQKANLSYYISNNGTTNMISPLITILEQAHQGDPSRAKYVPDILRALYSFEFYQVVRKFHRSDDDKLVKRKAMLDQLLGINLKEHPTELPEYFKQFDQPPKHYDQPEINQELLQKLIDHVFWLDNITILPDLILNSFKGKEGQKLIAELPAISDETCQRALKLDFDLKTFKFYCIVQSFLYCEKASRVDDEAKKMKIEDCGNQERMRQMIGRYVAQQYRADYQSRLAQQGKEERQILADDLAWKMAKTDDLHEFLRLFQEGLVQGHVSAKIYDTYQLGYVQLKDHLFDPNLMVPHRQMKLRVLIMGDDVGVSDSGGGQEPDGQMVWNKGNTLRLPKEEFDQLFRQVGLMEFWRALYPKYKEKCIYLYRDSDQPNRHTHCNSKPSFWALGYPNILAYFADITEDEKQEYMEVHNRCCGIWDGKVVKPF